jgi:hypothetical protein
MNYDKHFLLHKKLYVVKLNEDLEEFYRDHIFIYQKIGQYSQLFLVTLFLIFINFKVQIINLTL